MNLLKLIQKKEALKLALNGINNNFTDAFRHNFGCQGCSGSCSGSCLGDCLGNCAVGCAGGCADNI